MTDEAWRQFVRLRDRHERLERMLLVGAGAAVICAVVGAMVWMERRHAPPVFHQPVAMRCFPEGTELPRITTIFGANEPHPMLSGCPEWRQEEGADA